MTDRLRGVEVVFDQDMRDDDAGPLIDAIRCLKHVAEVRPLVASPDDWAARQRVRSEVAMKIHELLMEILTGKKGTG